MSDYTPTTEDVRNAYADWMADWDARAADFDRWLAVYTAEKQAEALEQAAREMHEPVAQYLHRESCTHWLRAEAQRLREQATNQQDRSK